MTITLGGATANPAEFAEALEVLYDAPGNQMKHYLKDTPLAGMDYHKVAKDEIALFPEIQVAPGTKQEHAAHVRPAVIHAMERVLAEAGWFDPTTSPQEPSAHDPGGGPGLDPIPGRRTAKQNYGEDQAKRWAEKEFPGALVEKVGNWVPKQGYDVRVTLADKSEVHIEAKYSESGSEVVLTEGERAHNQDHKCEHEHVLYLVAGAQVTKTAGGWHCEGGIEVPHRNWKIDTDNLKPRTWRYNVPS